MGQNQNNNNKPNGNDPYTYERINEDQLNNLYEDYMTYHNSNDVDFRRDIEWIEYIHSDLEATRDKVIDDAMDLFTDRLGLYVKTLMEAEEREEYETCSKLRDIIKVEKELCHNFLFHQYSVKKVWLSFHLGSVVTTYERMMELAREYNYNYFNAIKQLKNE